MATDESVSVWLGQLQEGDSTAVRKIWERYFHRLVGLARKKMAGTSRRVADEEDVALSAFDSFCRAAEANRFPELTNRENLWRLLVTITARKACKHARHESRKKRSGTLESESALEQVLSREPTPQFAAELVEQCDELLSKLPDAKLRAVAQWKMEGFTNEEIAAKLGCVVRSVERNLRVIRALWDQSDEAVES